MLEVHLPAKQEKRLELNLTVVNHGYQDFGVKSGGINGGNPGALGWCHVDVECLPANDPLRNQVRAVGAYTVSLSNGQKWESLACTGTLLNNTRQDKRPFFLTARHCMYSEIDGIPASGDPSSVVVYWNYQNSYCRPVGTQQNNGTNGNGTLNITNQGAYIRAQDSAADFFLFELDDPVNPNAIAYFAGWDRRPILHSGAVYTVHHPRGTEKRYSIDYGPIQFHDNNNFFKVVDWDSGCTAKNSSGSPLISGNSNYRVIGELNGGLSECAGPTGQSGTDNGKHDVYGRFSVGWDNSVGWDGTTNTGAAYWLDPLNTGWYVLNGINQ
ncbi:trypsin-like peptidase domain-containing protein [Candidatus Poribacteria bacterium]|nr:trypsin-like peptidase domain-containing protein [Candidatus Poribacteria bacterium]